MFGNKNKVDIYSRTPYFKVKHLFKICINGSKELVCFLRAMTMHVVTNAFLDIQFLKSSEFIMLISNFPSNMAYFQA